MSTQQNAQTPRDFIRAVEKKLKVKFIFDLACTLKDGIVRNHNPSIWVHLNDGRQIRCNGYYFNLGIDALKQDWAKLPQGRVLPDGTEEAGWINPPWKSIWEWSEKARLYSEGTCYNQHTGPDDNYDVVFEPPPLRLISLFPHGTSSQWRAHHVQGKADIYNLTPRVPYLNPETGDYYRTETGGIKTSQTDAILVDWAGSGNTYSWNWKETLDTCEKEG